MYFCLVQYFNTIDTPRIIYHLQLFTNQNIIEIKTLILWIL